MAKKLKDTDIHTDRQTYRLPLVVLSAALQQKTMVAIQFHLCKGGCVQVYVPAILATIWMKRAHAIGWAIRLEKKITKIFGTLQCQFVLWIRGLSCFSGSDPD